MVDENDIQKYKPTLEQVEFTLGQRGCSLLVYKGFTFVKNRRGGYKTYWICSKKGSTKCRARVVTNFMDGVEKIMLTSFEHNHPKFPIRKKRLPTKKKIIKDEQQNEDIDDIMLKI